MGLRKIYALIALIAICCCAIPSKAHPAPRLVKLEPNGESILSLEATDANTPEIHFWYVSKGNVSVSLLSTLAGPAGASAVVESHLLTGNEESTLSNPNGWNEADLHRPLLLSTPKPSSSSSSSSSSSTSSSSSSITSEYPSQQMPVSSDICNTLSDQSVQQLMEYWGNNNCWPIGQNPTKMEICQFLMYNRDQGLCGNQEPSHSSSSDDYYSGNNSSADLNQYENIQNTYGFVHKDSCIAQKTVSYIVRMKVSLAKVSPSAFEKGFKLKAGLVEKKYKGRKASTLKPETDGMYAPRPAFLIHSPLPYCSRYEETKEKRKYYPRINIVKWKKSSRALIDKPDVDWVFYYRDLCVAFALADKALVGGKGVVEIHSGYSNTYTEPQGYSLCFRLHRKRQSFFGYPK